MSKTDLEKEIDLHTGAWFRRTLPTIDLDNGGVVIPAPNQKDWERSVKENLKTLIRKAVEATRLEKRVPLFEPKETYLASVWNDAVEEQDKKIKELFSE